MTLRLLVILLLATGCTPSPPTTPTGTPAATSPPGTAATTAAVGFASCDQANANSLVLDALAAAPAYSVTAAGFTYVQDLPSDPNSAPTTRRARFALDARYVAPDRVQQRETVSAPGSEPAESIAIGADLWVRTPDGWDALPGAANPANANLIAAIVRDAGPGWEDMTTRPEAADLPGAGCAFRVRADVGTGGTGSRELTVRADRQTGRPIAVRLVVRDAFDPFRNRHDMNVLYRVSYENVAAIDPPASASPAP